MPSVMRCVSSNFPRKSPGKSPRHRKARKVRKSPKARKKPEKPQKPEKSKAPRNRHKTPGRPRLPARRRNSRNRRAVPPRPVAGDSVAGMSSGSADDSAEAAAEHTAAPDGAGPGRAPGGNGALPAKALSVRRARTSDIPAVRTLLDSYVRKGILLDKATVTLYEDIQEFWVAERDDNAEVVGCGALHVMWEDLAEVRTLAVNPEVRGAGVGHQVLGKLLQTARWLGVRRVFCLTFEVDFFARHGFVEIGETPVDHDVYSELLRSYDEGVAEFLGLERVKPNTLGNSRMLLHL
ncbi:N-acetylglutamate synthase, GNAT family [Streptomyces sp. IgraMP-1]|nr:N-acetylglutamate synthase, GNAT family [Streptomyces sp. IgraMP-1]